MSELNKIILGDNLEILRTMESESVDLEYLDPPFFSNRNYEVIWGDDGEIRSFQDRWSGGIDHYIAWLKERVIELHRVLKPTGSIFLHCDWHADAYIRVEILDKIFGLSNFRNKITWKRSDTHNDAKKQFPNVCDDIFYYSKTSKYYFSPQFTEHNPKTLKEWYQYLEFTDGTIRKMTKDENERQVIPINARRFNTDNMAAPAGGGMAAIIPETGKPRGWYIYKGYQPPTNGWRYQLSSMENLDKENRLFFPKDKNGRIMLKRFLDEQKGAVVGDLWIDIDQIRAAKKELIGYPTQKPELLMQRIIECASNEGDTILDPFVGGGTTVVVADKLKRKWIGIDQSVQAVKVTELRLQNQTDLFSNPYVVQLHKYDYDTLRFKDAFQFEIWIVTQFGGFPNIKQRGDLGMDGRMKDNTPIQVKRSDNIGRNVVDNFKSACERFDKALFEKNRAENKPVGYIIAFSFGKGAIQEVARLKNQENIIIQIVTVGDVVPISIKPTLKVELQDKGSDQKGHREIAFIATGSSAAGVEFYSWDFDYNGQLFKAEILLDKTGQQSWKFKPGHHVIAVKVVDNDGLENIEVIRLKVNGKIEVQ